MYVYITTGPTNSQYDVGYYTTKYSYDGKPYLSFTSESTHHTTQAAAARVNYLNGGTGQPPTHPTPYADTWRNPYKNRPGWQPHD
jgi:hypothetical protein